MCDLCDSPFHNNLHCAGFVTAADYGDWLCIGCRAVVHEEKKISLAKKKGWMVKPLQKKQKPCAEKVLRLQKLFPRLDYLMCETLLMQTEEELQQYLDASTEKWLELRRLPQILLTRHILLHVNTSPDSGKPA